MALEYSSAITETLETPGASSSTTLGVSTSSKTSFKDTRSHEEKVFGKGLFQSYPAETSQTHGIPWQMLVSGVSIVLSSLLVVLLGTNILIQLRTVIPSDRSRTAIKFVYMVLDVLSMYVLFVGNAWLYRKLSAHAHRSNSDGSYSSVSRLEENYEMSSIQ